MRNLIFSKHLLALGLLLTAALPAQAWGVRGHQVINRVAINTLPADGPVFLKAHAEDIAEMSTIPDTWRDRSEPFSKIAEDPNHGWFRQQFAFMPAIPRSRVAFELALHDEYLRIRATDPERAARTNVRWTGTLPYAAVETWEQLVVAMRTLRKARAEGRPTALHEQLCAWQAARLGHYIGDGAQPMHVSIHSDGWRGDNPEGYTRDRAVHGKVETRYVEMLALKDADITRRMPALAHQSGDVFDAVLAHVNAAGDEVEHVYRLEKAGAFDDATNREARELIEARVTAAAALLRDLVQRAWVRSVEKPAPVADPLDFNSPAFDPATGSAPAWTYPQR